jgi:putative transcriptional regulator
MHGDVAEQEFTNRLAEIRRAAQLTQPDLAEHSGVARETISNTERGVSIPSVAIALRLARALGVKVEALFSLDEGECAEPASIDRAVPWCRCTSVGTRLQRIEAMLERLLATSS